MNIKESGSQQTSLCKRHKAWTQCSELELSYKPSSQAVYVCRSFLNLGMLNSRLKKSAATRV